jgi:hypothetical protein
MKEKTVFIANDGTDFQDQERCAVYERISEAVNSLGTNPDTDIRAISDFVLSSKGEELTQRALACLYWSINVFSGIPEIEEMMPALFRRGRLETETKDGGSGIASQLLGIPANATDEQLGSVLRRFPPDRIATALETLEESDIPLCVYKRIRKYLFM